MSRGRLSKFLPWLLLAPLGIGLVLLEVHLKRSPPTEPRPVPEVVWVFKAPHAGAIISSPLVTEDRIYVGAIRDRGLNPGGIVYALDKATGKSVWKYDAGEEMIHMYSSPYLADGLLYIGEGMHASFASKLHCLEAATGKPRWRFGTNSHVESSPCVADGRVFFGAGDDGVYALDAQTGAKLWQFDDRAHVDSSPAVENGRVYAGSGLSRPFHPSELFALDAATGQP